MWIEFLPHVHKELTSFYQSPTMCKSEDAITGTLPSSFSSVQFQDVGVQSKILMVSFLLNLDASFVNSL